MSGNTTKSCFVLHFAYWHCVRYHVCVFAFFIYLIVVPSHVYPFPFTELMTPQEKIYWDNFKIHQHAAADHVKHIEQLQLDLEAASYERDTIMFDAINGTGKIGQLLKNRQKQLDKDKNKGKGGAEGPKVIKKPTLFQRMLGNTHADDEYRAMLMSPNPRERVMARDQYIAGIIDTALHGDETKG